MKVLIVFGFITLLLVPTALAQQPCSQTVAQAAAQRAKAVRTTLLAIKPEGDGLEPELRQQIQKLKDKLAATADASLHCATVATTAEKLQNELQSLLNANKTPKKPEWQDDSNAVDDADDDLYGADLNVKVSRAGDKTNLILVVFNFGIVCGDDSMLLGYEWKQEKWIRVLRWQRTGWLVLRMAIQCALLTSADLIWTSFSQLETIFHKRFCYTRKRSIGATIP